MLGMIEGVYREWLADPLNETARMIYADCLDDYGYEQQAIRVRSTWTPNLRISWENWMLTEESQYWHPDRKANGEPRPYTFNPETGPLFTPIIGIELETVPVLSDSYSTGERLFTAWIEGRDGRVDVTFAEVMSDIRKGVRSSVRIIPEMATPKLFAIHWPGITPTICRSAYALEANKVQPWMPSWFPRSPLPTNSVRL